MKFKKSSLKSLVLIAFVIGILLITGGIAITPDEKAKVDKVEKDGNKVKTNNSFFELNWDFDVTGYGADGLFYLKSSNFKTLDKNRSVYVGLLFPALISNNNKIFIEQKENIKQVTQKSFFCNTAKYGWEVFNQQIWCNTTFSRENNITLQSENYDLKTLYEVTSDNYLISTANNLTVFYNITTITEQFIKKDLSLSLINTEDKDIKTYVKKLNKDFSDLGNNWLLVNQPINLTLGESNKIEFKIDVNKSLLPLKYSVVIIDIDDNSYIIIDPTIVNARTWSNNDDFTNSTTLTNVSTSATGITLTTGSSILSQDGIVSYYALDNVYTDNTSHANTLTATGTPTFNTTMYKLGSHSWQGSGSNDYAQKVTPTGMILGAVNWSMSIWARTNTVIPADAVKVIYGMGYTGNDINFKNFQIDYYNNVAGGLRIGGRGYSVGYPVTLNVSTWYNIIVTYNASDKDFAMYLNGDFVTRGILGTALDVCNNVNNANCILLLADETNALGDNNQWSGQLDEWVIFNYTLIKTDVTSLWNSNSGLAYPLTNAAKTHGEYSDRQGWLPQSGNQISNITITADNSSGGNIRFRSNSTNASLDTSDWTILSNGTQTLQLNLGANNNIFYQFDFNGTGTGLISSYTINEGQAPAVTSSCTYVSGNWTIQGSEKCGLNSTDIGKNTLIFNGSGQIRILQNITNCSTVILQNGVDVTVTSGARLC